MRMKYYEEGKLVIKLKEEPGVYYDDNLSLRLPQLVGHPVNVYYSEKGELVEVRIGVLDPGTPFKQKPLYRPQSFAEEILEEGSNEIIIPDILPWKKYVFTFGRNEETPKACADHYNEVGDTDDRFLWAGGRLIIQRRDGTEMDRYEIEDLRRVFLEDLVTDRLEFFIDRSIESVYKDKKLYFWSIEEKNHPNSIEEFIQIIKEKLEVMGFDTEEVKERELGADILAKERELGADSDVTAVVCIADEKSFEEEFRTISREELIKACENTSEYKKRKIVYWDELSDDAKDWARSQDIEVQDFIVEFIAEFCMKRAEINDETALLDAKEWEEEILSEIFG